MPGSVVFYKYSYPNSHNSMRHHYCVTTTPFFRCKNTNSADRGTGLSSHYWWGIELDFEPRESGFRVCQLCDHPISGPALELCSELPYTRTWTKAEVGRHGGSRALFLSATFALAHSILPTTLWGPSYYHPHSQLRNCKAKELAQWEAWLLAQVNWHCV